MKKGLFLVAVLLNALFFSAKSQIKLNPEEIAVIWDTIDFDTPCSFLHLDTSSQNIWQIGHPNKTFFDSSYSTQKAIVTDTVNYYPPNNYSYFDIYIGSSNNGWYPFDIFIDFWHKFDSDTLKDGGFITVSWDHGQTWMNIIKDTMYGWITPGTNSETYNHYNLYTTSNSLFTGEYGFSGRSKQWIYTSIGWHMVLAKDFYPSDTMIVRFNFISDSINNPKEGWMIDHIRLYSIKLGGGIDELYSDNAISFSPNPFTTTTQITLPQTYHHIALALYDLQGKLLLQQNYTDTDKILLQRNNLNNGLYFLKLTLDGKWVETGKIVVSE